MDREQSRAPGSYGVTPRMLGLWLLGSVLGVGLTGMPLGMFRRSEWLAGLTAPFSIQQDDFLFVTAVILLSWVASLWSTRVSGILGPLLAAGLWTFWSLVVGGIGV